MFASTMLKVEVNMSFIVTIVNLLLWCYVGTIQFSMGVFTRNSSRGAEVFCGVFEDVSKVCDPNTGLCAVPITNKNEDVEEVMIYLVQEIEKMNGILKM